MRWNDTDGTVDVGLKGGNVTLQVGQESVIRVVNKSGSNLLEANYQAVRVRLVAEGGAQGQRLAVVLALADTDADSATTIGLVTETINNNQEGFVTTSGEVKNINTTGSLQGETWVDGDILYLSGTTSGRITNVKPSAPTHTIIIGYVVYAHANNGKIFVKVDNGYELDELHNVSITSPTDNQALVYESVSSLWKNETVDKTFVGLGNVDNTSDANKPISTATQTALNAKQDTLVSGTNIKTINGASVLGSGDLVVGGSTTLAVGTTPITSGTIGRVLFQGTGNVLQQSANLFWDNTNGRLGIGTATPEGVMHIVDQTLNDPLLFFKYNDNPNFAGGFFASRSRGTLASPTAVLSGDRLLSILGRPYRTSGGNGFNPYSAAIFYIASENVTASANGSAITFETTSNGSTARTEKLRILGNGTVLIGTTTDAGYKLDVNGTARIVTSLAVSTGKTFSAYTSGGTANDALKLELTSTGAVLGIQNSNATGFSGVEYLSNTGSPRVFTGFNNSNGQEFRFNNFATGGYIGFLIGGTSALRIANSRSVLIGTETDLASSILTISSTTKGFLPPRMATTQRDVITSVPAGLVIYNTTTNNLNTYNGSAWVELVDSADLGTGIPTFLADPTSENLAFALADTSGTGAFIQQDAATLTGPNLEQPIITGPVDITDQDASTANRIMTRDLALAEEAMNVAFWQFGLNTSGGNSGTGSSQGRSGSTATGWGRQIITSTAMRPSASGGITMKGDIPIAVAFFGAIDVSQTTNGSKVRIIVGDTGNTTGTPPRFGGQDALLARGFGAEVYWSTANARQEIRLFAYGASGYVVSTGAAFLNTFQGSHTIVVSSDGLGNIRLYQTPSYSHLDFLALQRRKIETCHHAHSQPQECRRAYGRAIFCYQDAPFHILGTDVLCNLRAQKKGRHQ